MSDLTTQMLPTLESLGVWAYWIIGLFAALESWWVTGVIAPGTLVVDAGGALVRLGHLGFVDLCWFVALGSIAGGEAGFATGRWLGARSDPHPHLARAERLMRRHGGLAIVAGRFMGPVSGFAPLAAALAGMERWRFSAWNAAGGVLFAAVHVSLGFVLGDLFARVGPYLPHAVLPLLIFAVFAALVWFGVRALRHGLPLVLRGLDALGDAVAALPPARRLAARHPRTARLLAARLETSHAGGLLATGIAALLLYLVGLLVDGALDLTLVPATAATDERLTRLIHAYWTPAGLAVAGWITQSGHVPVAATMTVGAMLALAVSGRRASAVALAIAVVGNALTVTLLKLAFARSRPDLAFFLESSHSFPSGHAAISVALYGTLAGLAWRERLIGPTTAIVAGLTAAAAIGGSRLYLIEHYLSDVLNGWTVGAIWLVIGMAVGEALRHRRADARTARPRRSLALLGAAVAAAATVAVLDPPARTDPAPGTPNTVTDVAEAVRRQTLDTEVSTLFGTLLPPVTVIATGLSASDLADSLAGAGWRPAPPPGWTSLAAALRAEITRSPDEAAAVPPAFRAGRPADATLRTEDTLLRLWNVGTTPGGAPVVALATAPASETRDAFVAAPPPDLLAALPVSRSRRIDLPPRSGRMEEDGRPWTWDGALVIADLAPSDPTPSQQP